MKMLLAAIAMTIATPALAQNATPTHANHASHSSQATGAHAGQTATDAHAGHVMAKGKKMPHCDKMKSGGKEMACRNKPATAPDANPHAGHDKSNTDPHAGHDMSSQ